MTQTVMSSVHNLSYKGKLPASVQSRHSISTTLLFSDTKIKHSCTLLVLLLHLVSTRAAATSLSQLKNKNKYVGMSNSTFFKRTLWRLIISKLAAQQRLKFGIWVKVLVASLMIGGCSLYLVLVSSEKPSSLQHATGLHLKGANKQF